MAGVIRFLERINNGVNRFTITVMCLAVIAVTVLIAWAVYAVKGSDMGVETDNSIDSTPTIVDRIKAIGQWEFLSINDEELIDTMRTGFFSDDELVRIYYGTLRLGIDLSKCSEEWIRTEKDTIFIALPEVRLLDSIFIDEARTRSFFESGKWSNADRKAMYRQAHNAMLKRCMTPENIAIAQTNAREQIVRMLQPIAEPKQIKIINGK